ncbi:MAG: DEAD/DEAH box helicase family protein, partial [Proteobacteria bacterium]|nr:DEAD/DEAH box helicase family protein [Pseudomonadota bacterium]
MRLRFDSQLRFQLDAVKAMVDLFCGSQQPLDGRQLLTNLRHVQLRNGITEDNELSSMDFSVEMETGTGKTYVYLRTIYELFSRIGWSRFVIVVPSVAIREGVLKNIEVTREHFFGLYGVHLEARLYDSSKLSALRAFGEERGIQVLIINIDAFNKEGTNLIHRVDDRLLGRRPIDLIQRCRPVLIVDEPQNLESGRARQALASLKPSVTLRYSATHRFPYHLVYRLDPPRAYELGLVKGIDVCTVVDERQPYLELRELIPGPRATFVIDKQTAQGPARKTMKVGRVGIDLAQKTGRSEYQGFCVDWMDARRQQVAFTNGVLMKVGDVHGPRPAQVMEAQVQETVRLHLEKELALVGRHPRIKVLSLFFIDRVANYVEEEGPIRCAFASAYAELGGHRRYKNLNLPGLDEVHGGYFACHRGLPKDTRGRNKADADAYSLIMRDKERLLGPDEPLRFIFSHSALREGWDNPNVFQVCTLASSMSELKKRQEIGRGLRLAVGEDG